MPFQLIPFLVQILTSLAISAIAYLIAPKPKGNQPDEVKDLEVPTSEAGIPIPVIFGDITMKSPNILWYGEKLTTSKKV